MAPSQLSQLKTALNSAGLNRTSQPKRKGDGKKGGSQERDRQKKIQKLEEIRKGLNKFDERETKVKHDVGGRNLKGVTGRPSQSKQAGLEQRKKTLLPEHKLKGHTGTFHDRRFGESDPNMTPEDRMLERYTRERELQRLGGSGTGGNKKSLFNLEDDEAFGETDGGNLGLSLTHGGRDVGDLEGDDFERMGMAAGLFDGEDPEEKWKGAIDERTVRRSHFGGFDDDKEDDLPERKKSKQEVMAEIIAKSKEYKYERQQQKEVDEDIRNEIDSGLDDLRALLNVAPENDIGSSANRMPLGKPAKARPVDPANAPVANPAADDMDYDQFVKSLAFDARAKPKDRTKTEDELAIEEKEKLEAAEASRLRRMRGEEDDEEDEGGKGRKRAKREADAEKRIPDADDLDDDWAEDDMDQGLELGKGLLGRGLEVDDEMAGSEDEEEGSEDENEGEEEGDEDSDDDDDEEDEDEEEEEEFDGMEDLDEDMEDVSDEERLVPAVKTSKAKSAKSKAAAKEIPYTFICPATHEDLQDILEGLESSALPTVIQRIRALYHPSLAQGNKEKLQDLLGVLLDHVLVLASGPNPAFQPINTLLPHIVALVNLNPISAAHHFIGKLVLMQKNLAKGLARGAELANAKTFPRAPELALLRLIGVIWSTSDFSHPVVAPAVLLIGQYLSQAKVRSVADIASGVFLCSLLSQYESLSKRLVPEALNFLATAMLYLNPRPSLSRVGTFPLPADIADDLPELRVPFKSTSVPSEACSLPDLLVGEVSEQAKVDLMATSLRLVLVYAQAYSPLDAFIEIFTPLQEVVSSLRLKKASSEVQTLQSNTKQGLTRMLGFASQSRVPLRMQAHKPIPIATYMPKFVENYSISKRYDPDAERNATNKLKAMYKKERKGAIRELRKDNKFLAGEKAREQAVTDAAYNAKMRRIEGDITSERAEEKQMQREKGREKRRAGRK